jgi:predicted amidohydrolase
MKLRVACLQLSPGNDLAQNLRIAREGLASAASQGAHMVALPEFALFLDRRGREMAAAAAPEADNPALESLREAAREARVWLMLGSLVVRDDECGLLSNRSFVITDRGDIAARYDKIHMFDAALPSGKFVSESKAYRAGQEAVLVDTPWGGIGLTICYDLRFPHLYRTLAQAGARILMVPAAFAHETGSAHWRTLLAARAIENGCFVVAAATCGTHPGEWRTWGHSAIVDPWGRTLAEAQDAPATIFADLDLAAVERARGAITSLSSQPPFDLRRCGEHPSRQTSEGIRA